MTLQQVGSHGADLHNKAGLLLGQLLRLVSVAGQCLSTLRHARVKLSQLLLQLMLAVVQLLYTPAIDNYSSIIFFL